MSTVEFKLDEVVRLLSSERNLSQDLVLQALADALVAAYKSEPGAAAEAEVEIDAGTYDYRVIAYDAQVVRTHRRPALPPGLHPAGARGRT
jgi:hypothetical protein